MNLIKYILSKIFKRKYIFVGKNTVILGNGNKDVHIRIGKDKVDIDSFGNITNMPDK